MEEYITQIAERLKGLRDVLEISVEDISRDCNLNPEAYTKYESGKCDIPVGVLHVIARTYNIELATLLTGEEPRMHQYALTRKMQGNKAQRNTAYKYYALAQSFIQRKADPFLVTVEPKEQQKPLTLNTHTGQEFNYILEGSLKLFINDKEMILNEGDSIYFDSSLPHGMIALDEKACQFLAIIL